MAMASTIIMKCPDSLAACQGRNTYGSRVPINCRHLPRRWSSSATGRSGCEPCSDLGRNQFLDKVWEWKEESGATINHPSIRRACSSVAWSRERFTWMQVFSMRFKEAFVRPA